MSPVLTKFILTTSPMQLTPVMGDISRVLGTSTTNSDWGVPAFHLMAQVSVLVGFPVSSAGSQASRIPMNSRSLRIRLPARPSLLIAISWG